LAAVEFENSSLHATCPLGTFAATAWVVTVLLLSPDATVTAFSVTFDVRRNGAMYWVEEAVGVLPSVV
jgi:hypothetical protein